MTHVHLSRSGGVGVITIHRVPRFNSLDVVEIAIVLNVIANAVKVEICAGTVAAHDQLITIVLALMRRYSRNVVDDVADALK